MIGHGLLPRQFFHLGRFIPQRKRLFSFSTEERELISQKAKNCASNLLGVWRFLWWKLGMEHGQQIFFSRGSSSSSCLSNREFDLKLPWPSYSETQSKSPQQKGNFACWFCFSLTAWKIPQSQMALFWLYPFSFDKTPCWTHMLLFFFTSGIRGDYKLYSFRRFVGGGCFYCSVLSQTSEKFFWGQFWWVINPKWNTAGSRLIPIWILWIPRQFEALHKLLSCLCNANLPVLIWNSVIQKNFTWYHFLDKVNHMNMLCEVLSLVTSIVFIDRVGCKKPIPSLESWAHRSK